MQSNEARHRLLVIASERLCNRPGGYEKFLNALANTAVGEALMLRAQTLPFAWGAAEQTGSDSATKLIAEHLTAVVDWWAESQPATKAASPQPTPGLIKPVAPSGETLCGTPAIGQSAAAHVRNKLKPRTNALTAVINRATTEALDPGDWQSVWAKLVAIASRADRPAPLLGYTEGEGLKYQTDKEAKPVAWLTREALRGRCRVMRKQRLPER